MLPSLRDGGSGATLGLAALLSLLSTSTTSAFSPHSLGATNLLQTSLCPQPTFDIREATISSIHNALFSGLTTCHSVVSSYLARIESFNPSLHAVLSLNPNALNLAASIDEDLSLNNATSIASKPLLCIPVLLKDNFDTLEIPTTGGSLSLKDNRPAKDAPTVAAFKEAGAIILGKTNLHEFALEGISVSSLGGQTVNPYDHTRTPGGSSGGTGAAIAANFAVLGTGTDTVNSLRSPASANSLWSFRPTRGLISREGVIPVGWTQDTVGGMARTVEDLAVMMTVMSSTVPGGGDNTTALVPPGMKGVDYRKALYSGEGKLKGLRLGVLNGFWNHTAAPETDPVNEVMSNTLKGLEQAGVELVNITDPVYDALDIAARLDVQTWEFREGLDAYFSSTTFSPSSSSSSSNLASSSGPRSFSEIYTGKNKTDFLVLPSQYSYICNAFNRSTSSPEYFVRQRGISHLQTHLAQTFSANNLDAIIYPEQKNLVVKIGSPSQSGRNGILAALTGSPVITMPVGFSEATEEAPVGVPVGMEILGRKWSDEKLLGIGKYVGEVLGPIRQMPTTGGLDKVVEVKGGGYEEVPEVKGVDGGNIPGVYPSGTY